MKNIFLFGLLSLFLWGCGGDMICDCFDQSEDAVFFTFNTNTNSQGFKPEEIDTFYVYQLAKDQNNVLDSAIFIYNPVSGYHTTQKPSAHYSLKNGVFLNHGSPFGKGKIGEFDYVIEIPKLKTYQIKNLQIYGIQGKGDCGCYTNTKKLVTVNGTQYDLTGKDPQQNAIVLTK